MRNNIAHELNESKSFCAAPWAHLHTFPDGTVTTCCLSPYQSPMGNLQTESIVEVWNSDRIRKLRTDMLDGVLDSENCHRCYSRERDGFQSLRTSMNASYTHKFIDQINGTTEDGTVAELNLVHWDFRFSNLCNLSCRSCGPGLSSSWHGDAKKVWNLADDSKALIKINDDKIANLLDTALQSIDKVQSIHFAGGEPIMMSEHWVLLDALRDRQKFDVDIRYSTNMTKFNYGKKSVLDYWGYFNNIRIAASIDGMGDKFNYIRHGGKWSDVERNLHTLKNVGFTGVAVTFHPTVSILNILDFPDFIKYVWSNDNFSNIKTEIAEYFIHMVEINPLTFPAHMSAKVLPRELKELATQRLTDLIAWVKENITYTVTDELSGELVTLPTCTAPVQRLIDFMWQADDSHLLPEFLRFTTELDELRGEDFFKTFPEFESLRVFQKAKEAI